MENMLDLAIEIALNVHKNQLDKGGSPYILHPLRVMEAVDTEQEKIVAVLHDVVEDSCMSYLMLARKGFDKEVLDALDCLTRRCGESYNQYLDRIKPNPLARKIKLADLEDNSNLDRIPNFGVEDYLRVKKYQKAIKRLNKE
jgi:(p)ppGpp synthase/HD superfamily hydrolase